MAKKIYIFKKALDNTLILEYNTIRGNENELRKNWKRGDNHGTKSNVLHGLF